MKRWTALSCLLLCLIILFGAFPQSISAQETVEPPVEAVEAEASEEEVAEVPATPLDTYKAEMDYTINTLIMMICAVLVLFMQAGFALVEVGLNSQKNAVNIMFKNLMDLCIGVMLYWAFGFNLMYPGADYAGKWFGAFVPYVARDAGVDVEGVAIANDVAYGFSHSADFLFQVAFAATAATIVSGAVAGRMKFSAYLAYSAILTGLIYPISGMWKWGGGALAVAGFEDFAGSVLVHAVGGFAGLAGAIALGPRLGRFTKDGKSKPIPGHNISFAALGVFVLWVGWYGFNPGSQLRYSGTANAEATTFIALTTTLAAAAGSITAMSFAWGLFGKPDLTMALNGALAGLVSITANCDRVGQVESVIIGVIGGVLVVIGILALEKFNIDDPVGAFPVHGVCGVWGGLATGIFGDIRVTDGVAAFDSQMAFFLCQLKSTAIVCAWSFVSMMILFYALKSAGMLRVSEEEEVQGLDLGEHGMQAYTTS